MTGVMYAVGKARVADLGPDDLVCLDPWLARALRLPYAGVSPRERDQYYRGAFAPIAGAEVHPEAGQGAPPPVH
jgi:hypothetical protein